MAKLEIEGFDEATNRRIESLLCIKLRVSELPEGLYTLATLIPEEKMPSFQELFTPAFMKKYTKYDSIESMVQAIGYPLSSWEEGKRIPEKVFDRFISKNTQFSNGREFLARASGEWGARANWEYLLGMSG